MAIDYSKRRSNTPVTDPSGVSASGGAGSKVTLTKAAPSMSLLKQGATGGVLRINLNWNARPASPGGFFGRAGTGSAVDLDLGCLYEFNDGTLGVVQALGKLFRSTASFTNEPVIWLDGDDRSGSNSGGENLFVNLAYADQIRRILVFASIYEGAPNWAAVNGVVTLFPASGPQIEVRLDEHDARSPLCAIALLTGTDTGVSVRREVRYIQGSQRDLDLAYGWGLNWVHGSK